jgi:hypothetical protein
MLEQKNLRRPSILTKKGGDNEARVNNEWQSMVIPSVIRCKITLQKVNDVDWCKGG